MAKIRMKKNQARDFGKAVRTLLKNLSPYKWGMAVSVFFAVAGTLFSIVAPAILGKATDIAVRGVTGEEGVDFRALAGILLFLLILYVCSLLAGVIQGWIMARVSQRFIYDLRERMSLKLDRMPLRYFDSRSHGEIQSRMINDIETINETLSVSLTQMITSCTVLAGIVVMMLRINILMTVTVVLVLPLSAAVMKIVIARTQGYFREQQSSLGSLNGHVEEMYSGHEVVKAFGREDTAEDVFEEFNGSLYRSAWKAQFLSGIMMPLINFIGNIAYVAVCLLGGYLAVQGRITIGGIQAFIQYVRGFSQPAAQVASVINQFQSVAAAAERVFELLDEEEEEDLQDDGGYPEDLKGEVVFDHVHFGYNEDETVINDFSFKVYPGQRIAIVGHTGAGKTTLVKLLMRFYELGGGRIMIDGRDISTIPKKRLRRMFGMVLQETWLSSGSIRDNIKYGSPGASDESVEAAAKAARIDHFIRSQSRGYDMDINEEGSNISQGQKQLLTIARVFLADAPVLILDEATSSVDTRTEVHIQEAMQELMKGRTSFIIAHRLSTIREADNIIVMDNGDIAEYGTHDELIAMNGVYADLYNSQFSR